MIRINRTKIALGLGALAVAFAASEAHAGSSDNTQVCAQYRDHSGVCYGSLAAFRASSNSTDYAQFTSYPDSSGYFLASLNGSYYSCAVDSSSPASVRQQFLSQATVNRGGFYVYWDTTGHCTGFFIYNGSMY